MLTTKLHEDGDMYHAQYSNTNDVEFILDEDGNMIPAHFCLCHAHNWSECCCGCTSWDEDDLYD